MPAQHGRAPLRHRPRHQLPTALRLSTHRVTLRPSPPEGDVASATPDEPVRSRRGGVAFLITDHGHVVGNASSAALTGDRSITGLSADTVAALVAALSPLRHERHQARRASPPRKRAVSADAKHWLVFTDRPPSSTSDRRPRTTCRPARSRRATRKCTSGNTRHTSRVGSGSSTVWLTWGPDVISPAAHR